MCNHLLLTLYLRYHIARCASSAVFIVIDDDYPGLVLMPQGNRHLALGLDHPTTIDHESFSLKIVVVKEKTDDILESQTVL